MRFTRELVVSLCMSALVLLGGAAACSSSNDAAPSAGDAGPAIPGRACPTDSTLTYESFGRPFVLDWCSGCHSSAVTGDARRNAPPTTNFDSLADVRAKLVPIWNKAADDHTSMPPAGGPSSELRHQFGDWLACGAPGNDTGFDVTPGDAAGPPQPTGACAAPHLPLPASMMPRCSEGTRACILACTYGDCAGKCLAADTMPKDPATQLNCGGCYYEQLLACADPQCHGPISEFLCCLYAKCANGDPNCAQTKCSAEISTYSLCLYYVTPSCLQNDNAMTGACFAPPVDGGGGDAAAGDAGAADASGG